LPTQLLTSLTAGGVIPVAADDRAVRPASLVADTQRRPVDAVDVAQIPVA